MRLVAEVVASGVQTNLWNLEHTEKAARLHGAATADRPNDAKHIVVFPTDLTFIVFEFAPFYAYNTHYFVDSISVAIFGCIFLPFGKYMILF